MNKVSIWSERPHDGSDALHSRDGLEAVKGLLIGLAISQVFWAVVLYFVL